MKWTEDVLKIFPTVRDHPVYTNWRTVLDSLPLDGNLPTSPPIERHRIPLPSLFTHSERENAGLSMMAQYEEMLRRGSASELLEGIRQTLIRYNWNLGKMIAGVHGQAGNTRFVTHLGNIHSEARESACV